MKKHSSKLLLIVLVLVLCLSTVVLSACNDDKNPPEEPPVDTTVATGKMIDKIISNITSSIGIGENFGADIEATFVLDDKTAQNKDVSFKLTGKGNVALQDGANESDTDFAIEIVEQQGETTTVLLGIAYEVIDNDPYFFINLLGSGYKKINGYSLTALYNLVSGGATTQADDGGLGADMIVSMVMPMLFGEKGKVENNVYTLRFDLAKTVDAIMEMKEAITALLSSVGMSEADLNALIAEYLGELSYEYRGETVHVSDLDTLARYLKVGMSFKGNIVFAFDENDKFVNASASFDYANAGEDVANYTLRVDKMQIGETDTAIDVFANFPLSRDERALAQAVNLLNFSLRGTATAYNDKNEVAHNYTIEVQADIEPFALFDLLKGTDKANIIATLKKLGYFHLEINEVFDDPEKEPLNIIMLHSNFEEGFAVANVHAYKAVLYNVGLGGVYDFDALIDVIGMLSASSDEPSQPEEPTEPAETPNIMETLDNIKNTVQDVLGYFTIDNMQEDGVTVALKDLVFMICDMVGLDTSGLTGTGISAILGCNAMNIKCETPTHGTCTKVETSTIKCGIRETDKLKAVKDGEYDLSASQTAFIKEIVSLDGFTGRILQGDSTFAKYLQGYVAFDKAFLMTGVDLAGNEIQTSGFIMAVDGFDPNKVGEQQVTFYIAIANDMLDFARAGFAFDDIIPLSGTLKFQTTVEVLPFDANAEVSVSNIKTEDQKALVGDKAVFDIIRTRTSNATEMTIGTLGTYNVDASMVRIYDALEGGNDVTAQAIDADGKFVDVGEYYVRLMFAGYSANCCKIVVENAYAQRADGQAEVESIQLGGTWNFGEYEVYAVDAQGNAVKQAITPQYRIGSTTLKSLDEAFDIEGNVYTLKKNLDYVGKNFTIRFNNVPTANGQKKTVDVNIAIESDYVLDEKLSGLFYFGKSLNEEFVLSIHDVQYKVVYKNGAWVAVNENGDEKAVELSLNWTSASGDAVEVNEAGFITNYPNVNKAGTRSTKVYYTLTIDGYTYSYNFTAYELGASNKTVNLSKTPTLDGAISNVGKIAYTDKDGEVAELEFKFGAEGYAIYEKGTDIKVIDVTVTITVDGTDEAYNLTDGKFTEVGKYKVEYSLVVNGIEQTFFHTVTVKA